MMRITGLGVLMLAGLLALAGCTSVPRIPEYATAVDETNAAMREIADLLPLTTDELLREGDPFTCGNMFEPTDRNTPVFYTGNLTLNQPPGFDAEGFIAQLAGTLSAEYEIRRPHADIDDGTTLYLTAKGAGPGMSVSADSTPGEEHVYIVATSRCAKQEPPAVADSPLPVYATVRDEAEGVVQQIIQTLPPSTRQEADYGDVIECDDLVDPFTETPPVHHRASLNLLTPEGFDSKAFVEELPSILGGDFDVVPDDVDRHMPSVMMTAHASGEVSVLVTAPIGGMISIWVDSRCARGDSIPEG